MEKYINLSSNLGRWGGKNPLFWVGSIPLSTEGFNNLLKQAVRLAGYDSNIYSAHSLRSGAATSAYNTGISPELIKRLGRWSSDCYQIYVKDPKFAVRKVHKVMESKAGNHT